MSEINRVYYNKLVRDNIPAKIEAKREKCEIRKITDVQELQQELFKKIQEEASSLAMSRTKEEFLEEYCDLMVVIDTLIRQLEIPKEERIKKSKALFVKFIEISIAFSIVFGQYFIPIPDKIYSLILPTPGIFLIGSYCINSRIAFSLKSK